MEEEDWRLASALVRPKEFSVPNKLAVYAFISDAAVAKDRMRSWFRLQQSLTDGATKGAYPYFSLQGDLGMLRDPVRRAEFYWALSAQWDSARPVAPAILAVVESRRNAPYRTACEQLGHPFPLAGGLIPAQDELLQQLQEDPSMVPFPKMGIHSEGIFALDGFCSGYTSVANGMDIRMYFDKASGPAGHAKPSELVGCRTVSLARFGRGGGIDRDAPLSIGVHGGAIQALMDEVTAECVKYWATGVCVTRKISHNMARAVYQFKTYKVVCEISAVSDDSIVYTVKGKVLDQDEAIVHTQADLVDTLALSQTQRA